MKKVGAYMLMGTALLACPCHLAFLLPAALGLLGGTALGTALGPNLGWVIAAATVYFVTALAGGLYLLNRRAREEKEGERTPTPANRKAGPQPAATKENRPQAGARRR